jgi:hypothetical protein
MATTKATTLAHGQAGAIVSGTFATARIADDAINLDKLAHLGTDGHVLTSTGTGTAPAFEAIAGGYTLVAYKQGPAPDSSVFAVDNVFSDTYESYSIVIESMIGATNMDTAEVYLRFIDDEGSEIGGSHYWYANIAKDSGGTDRIFTGESEANMKLSGNMGAASGAKEGMCGELIFSGTRTENTYSQVHGHLAFTRGDGHHTTSVLSCVYKGTGSGSSGTKIRGFNIKGGGSSNKWTVNAEGGVYVFGYNNS